MALDNAAQKGVPGDHRDNAPAKKEVHYAQASSVKAAGAGPVRGWVPYRVLGQKDYQSMKTNLDLSQLGNVASLAKVIREWIGNHNHPEKYAQVKDLELVRDFVHILDLLETVLIHFEISVHLSKLALEQLENPAQVGSLGWEFWQIDIEEFFASNLPELCYQVSNAWEELDRFANKDKAFEILRTKHKRPSDILLARHKATHFQPMQFENHYIAKQYSILRRPYQIQDGKPKKELAKETMPRVAKLVQDAVKEGVNYLSKFREATIG